MSTRRTLLVAAAASLAYAGPAAAQSVAIPPPPPPITVTVTGTGSVTPVPVNRTSNASIARAVANAKAAAAPLAIADGRARATNLATLNHLVLGGLLAITEGPSITTPFFFAGPFAAQDGTFGPGRYCGTVRTAIYKRDRAGKRKRVGVRTHRSCRVPPTVSVSYGMTFSASPLALL